MTYELLMFTRAKSEVESHFGAVAAAVPSRLTAHEALELPVRRAHCMVEEKGLVVRVVRSSFERTRGREGVSPRAASTLLQYPVTNDA